MDLKISSAILILLLASFQVCQPSINIYFINQSIFISGFFYRKIFGAHQTLFKVNLFLKQEFVQASGIIEVELLSYANPKHRLHNGKCCEEGIERKCEKNEKNRCITCSLECDPQFEIELKQNNKELFWKHTPTIAYKDNFYFADHVNKSFDFPNPFSVKLPSFEVNRKIDS